MDLDHDDGVLSSMKVHWFWIGGRWCFFFPNWLFRLGVKFRLPMKMVKDIEFISRG